MENIIKTILDNELDFEVTYKRASNGDSFGATIKINTQEGFTLEPVKECAYKLDFDFSIDANGVMRIYVV